MVILWLALMICAFVTGHVVLGAIFLVLWLLAAGSAD